MFYAGVSKYLRHSEAVANKHYDFSAVEQSSRNRETILNLVGGRVIFISFSFIIKQIR